MPGAWNEILEASKQCDLDLESNLSRLQDESQDRADCFLDQCFFEIARIKL